MPVKCSFYRLFFSLIALSVFTFSLKGQITHQELIQKHLLVSGKYSQKALETILVESTGTLEFYGVRFDFTAYQQKDKLNCQLKTPDVIWQVLVNDSIRWFTDPVSGKPSFDSPYDLEFESMMRSRDLTFVDITKQDYDVLGLQEVALLDSIPAYLLALKTAKNRYNCYFDKESYAFLGYEIPESMRKLYLDHQELSGMLLPKLYIVETDHKQTILKTASYRESSVSPTIFDLPVEALEALKELESVKADPDDMSWARMIYFQASELTDQRKLGEALELLNLGLEKVPDNPGLLNGKGLVYLYQKEYNEAINYFKASLKYRENNPTAFYNLGMTNETMGRINEAEDYYKKAIEFSPRSSHYYARLGLLYYKTNQYPEAYQFYDKAIALDPFKERNYFFRGACHMVMGEDLKAMTDFKKAVSLGYETTSLYESMGMVAVNLNNRKEAATYFKKAIDLSPRLIRLRETLADIYDRLDMPAEVVKETNEILKIDRKNIGMRALRAYNLYRLGEYDLAEKDLNIAIKASPESFGMYLMRGRINMHQKEYEDALTDFNHYLKYEEFGYAYVSRGMAFVNMQKISEGCADFQKAKELGFNDAQEFIDEHCSKD